MHDQIRRGPSRARELQLRRELFDGRVLDGEKRSREVDRAAGSRRLGCGSVSLGQGRRRLGEDVAVETPDRKPARVLVNVPERLFAPGSRIDGLGRESVETRRAEVGKGLEERRERTPDAETRDARQSQSGTPGTAALRRPEGVQGA